ncbi:V-type ATP synthase subunit C [Clostridium manihotivorum]|uniref:V-type ATP synthase subunit C n=1 Tax=Clostridium manihotivorum TaxID=2320868 RepID=A0A3R5R0U9_9CLOT|nr:V-type ATP synthase subunit C [Clostridium manihotivorum]QAA34062.1 V-type ATP synthase subunit C [Clostridium manihotivorum]
MEAMDFTQVIPRIRVLENRLLDKAKIDRMVDAASIEEVLKILQETEYSNVSNNSNNPRAYEVMLSDELKRVFNLMYEVSPYREIVDIMSIKYDFHNIKVLIKSKVSKKDMKDILINIGTVELHKLSDAVMNDSYRDIPKVMAKAIEEVFLDFSKEKDPQRIDLILDRYQYQAVEDISERLKNPFIERYVDFLIDLSNIRTLLRVKKQKKGKDFLKETLLTGGKLDRDKILILLNESPENIYNKLAHTDYAPVLKSGIEDYIKTQSASKLEKLSDNYLMNFMKDAKYVTFGPEPILAYIYAKESEIKNIRIIMVGKLNNISSEVIRERLREVYV